MADLRMWFVDIPALFALSVFLLCIVDGVRVSSMLLVCSVCAVVVATAMAVLFAESRIPDDLFAAVTIFAVAILCAWGSAGELAYEHEVDRERRRQAKKRFLAERGFGRARLRRAM